MNAETIEKEGNWDTLSKKERKKKPKRKKENKKEYNNFFSQSRKIGKNIIIIFFLKAEKLVPQQSKFPLKSLVFGTKNLESVVEISYFSQ